MRYLLVRLIPLSLLVLVVYFIFASGSNAAKTTSGLINYDAVQSQDQTAETGRDPFAQMGVE